MERFKALTLSLTTSRRNNDEQNKRTSIPDLISMGKKEYLGGHISGIPKLWEMSQQLVQECYL